MVVLSTTTRKVNLMKSNKTLRNMVFVILATMTLLISACKSEPNDGLFTGRDKLVRIVDNIELGQTCEMLGGYKGQDGNCYAK